MAIQYHTMRDEDGEVSVRAIHPKNTREAFDNGHPIADLYMKPPREVPNFVESPSQPGKQVINSEYPWHNPGKWQPDELFSHVPPQISGAFADPRMRHTLPTMVGIAMNRMGASKDVPMADSSLTEYSSALSRNAVERGLAVPHYFNRNMTAGNETEDEEGNTIYQAPDVSNMPERTSWDTAMYGWDPVPHTEVAAARQWVREKVRGPQQPKRKNVKRGDSQFEQLNLGI